MIHISLFFLCIIKNKAFQLYFRSSDAGPGVLQNIIKVNQFKIVFLSILLFNDSNFLSTLFHKSNSSNGNSPTIKPFSNVSQFFHLHFILSKLKRLDFKYLEIPRMTLCFSFFLVYITY